MSGEMKVLAPSNVVVGRPLRGRELHLPTEGSEGLPHKLFVREWAVGLGRVEEGHTEFDGRPDQRDHLLPVRGRTVHGAHAHAAEPKSRNFQVAFSSLRFCIGVSFTTEERA
jgi:hypothetical protein